MLSYFGCELGRWYIVHRLLSILANPARTAFGTNPSAVGLFSLPADGATNRVGWYPGHVFVPVEKSTMFQRDDSLHTFQRGWRGRGTLNKERKRGTFKLKNNVNVPYQYIGAGREKFHADFSFKGPVQAWCIAEFNDALQVTRLEIKAVQPLQSRLALSSGDSTKDKSSA